MFNDVPKDDRAAKLPERYCVKNGVNADRRAAYAVTVSIGERDDGGNLVFRVEYGVDNGLGDSCNNKGAAGTHVTINAKAIR